MQNGRAAILCFLWQLETIIISKNWNKINPIIEIWAIRILKKLFFKKISIYNHFHVIVLWYPEFLVGWLLLMMLAFPLIKLFMHYHLACNSVIIFTMWIPHNCFASNHNVEKPKRILLLFLLVVFNNGDGLSIYVSVNLYTFICRINAENTRTIYICCLPSKLIKF